MITCPHCLVQNTAGNRFCISCGQSLENAAPVESHMVLPEASVYQRQLGMATGQTLIALLLVWLVQTTLVGLSFVEGLRLPNIPLTVPQIITFIAYLIAFILLLTYANTLGSYWSPAYPRLASLTPVITVVIYVVLISLAYRALLPVIRALVDDPGDFILVLRVALTIVVLVLLIWAARVAYEVLTNWLSNIRFSLPRIGDAAVACLHCGHLNVSGMKFCSNCGQSAAQGK